MQSHIIFKHTRLSMNRRLQVCKPHAHTGFHPSPLFSYPITYTALIGYFSCRTRRWRWRTVPGSLPSLYTRTLSYVDDLTGSSPGLKMIPWSKLRQKPYRVYYYKSWIVWPTFTASKQRTSKSWCNSGQHVEGGTGRDAVWRTIAKPLLVMIQNDAAYTLRKEDHGV